MSNTELVGIRRFHKVTISAGVIFCGLVALRFGLTWSRTGQDRYLLYTVIAIVAMAGLGAYLLRFWRTGLR